MDDEDFPGSSCLTNRRHGYWGARKIEHVRTEGIWIAHASRGGFDVFVDETQLPFQSDDTLSGCSWHGYRPMSKYDPGCTLTEITIRGDRGRT